MSRCGHGTPGGCDERRAGDGTRYTTPASREWRTSPSERFSSSTPPCLCPRWRPDSANRSRTVWVRAGSVRRDDLGLETDRLGDQHRGPAQTPTESQGFDRKTASSPLGLQTLGRATEPGGGLGGRQSGGISNASHNHHRRSVVRRKRSHCHLLRPRSERVSTRITGWSRVARRYLLMSQACRWRSLVPALPQVPTMRPSGLRHAGGASSPLRR